MVHLLSLAFALVLAISITQAVMPLYLQSIETPRNFLAGYQMRDVAEAAYRYVNDRIAEIDDRAASSGGITTIEVSELAAGLKLPPGTTGDTLNGQTIRILVRRLSEGVLQGVVKGCGGTAFTDRELLAMAPFAVNLYGTPAYIQSTDTATIEALGPGRSLVASSFSTAACPAAEGQLAVSLFWDGTDTATSTFLNRYIVPGLGVEPNTMHTDIYMDGCNDVATSYVDGCNVRGARAVQVTRGVEFLYNGTVRWRLGPDTSGNLVLTRLNTSGSDIGATVTYNLSNNATTFASEFFGPYYGYSASDPVLKKNWAAITGKQQAAVMSIQPRTFNFIQDGRPGVGFNAAEVADKVPMLVNRDPTSGRLAVAYPALIPFHHQQLIDLTRRVQQLTDQTVQQQEVIGRLETQIGEHK
jgi:hypothetical protein